VCGGEKVAVRGDQGSTGVGIAGIYFQTARTGRNGVAAPSPQRRQQPLYTKQRRPR
jgi:hypothetical protein